MKEIYSLIDKKEETWKLGKVTPRREKLLTKLGLVRENFDSSKEENVDTVLKKLLDEQGEGLLGLLNGLFDGRIILKEELEDVDKTEVKVAVFSFFLRDLVLLSEFGNLIPTSSLLKSMTPESDSSKA